MGETWSTKGSVLRECERQSRMRITETEAIKFEEEMSDTNGGRRIVKMVKFKIGGEKLSQAFREIVQVEKSKCVWTWYIIHWGIVTMTELAFYKKKNQIKLLLRKTDKEWTTLSSFYIKTVIVPNPTQQK